MIVLERLLRECYVPCVLTYFDIKIFDRYPYLKEVYDTDQYRRANVKAVYMFSEGHHFKSEDAASYLINQGMVLLPLFITVNCENYANSRSFSIFVHGVYSPMLVWLWENGASSQSAAIGEPLEVYVQRDCVPLREIRNSVTGRLFNMVDKNNRRTVFVPMKEATVIGVERTGKSNLPMI